MKSPGLSLQEYAAKHQVTERQIQTYIARGLPVRRVKRKGGGRPRIVINVTTADAWMIENGIVTKGMSADAFKKTVGSTPPEKPPSPAAKDSQFGFDSELVKKYGLLGALERFRLIERTVSKLLLNAYQGKDGPTIATLQKQIPAVIAQLRQLELGALEYKRQAGELLPSDEVKAAGHRVSQHFRNKLMALGHAIVPRLALFVKDQGQFPEIQTIIDNVVREQLRDLPENVFATGE